MPKSVIVYKGKLPKRVTAEERNINKRGRVRKGRNVGIVKKQCQKWHISWQNRRGRLKRGISTLGYDTPTCPLGHIGNVREGRECRRTRKRAPYGGVFSCLAGGRGGELLTPPMRLVFGHVGGVLVDGM